MSKQYNSRINVKMDAATVKLLDDIANTFYGGSGHGKPGRGVALESAVIAWATIVRDASTHGLANEPHKALRAWRDHGQRELPGME